MKQNKCVVIGVTGGIGSGKSTVSNILRDLGAVIIDADLICREIVEPGEKALIELTEAFGKDILDKYGHLNRKQLAEMVFNNDHNLTLINGIMHKHVADRIKSEIDEFESAGCSVIVIDAPIPIEHGFLDFSDVVWTVVSAVDNRIERVKQRSGMTRDEALARIKAQIPEQEYISIADIVITNNSSYDDLVKQVKENFKKLLGGLFEV